MTDHKFKIEKSVPVPMARSKVSDYPFDEMNVGDSFLIPTDEKDKRIIQSRVSGSAVAKAYKTKMKFSTRCVDGGVRVWRVE